MIYPITCPTESTDVSERVHWRNHQASKESFGFLVGAYQGRLLYGVFLKMLLGGKYYVFLKGSK